MLSVAKFVAIILGSMLIGIGINFFLIPFKVLDGGIIGISLIVKYIWQVKVGLTMILCSVPIFILAWFRYRNYFYNSLHGLLVSSLFIDLLHPYQNHFSHYIDLSPPVSSIIGGVLVGTGIGVMLRFETSTGGTDLLAQFISDFFTINVGVMVFVFDIFVICLGGLMISAETFFLSIITICSGGAATTLCTLKR